MEAKDLLKSLEKDFVKVEKDEELSDFTGGYFMVVGLQGDTQFPEGSTQFFGRVNTDFLKDGFCRVFEALYERDKGASTALLEELFVRYVMSEEILKEQEDK